LEKNVRKPQGGIFLTHTVCISPSSGHILETSQYSVHDQADSHANFDKLNIKIKPETSSNVKITKLGKTVTHGKLPVNTTDLNMTYVK